MKTTKTGIQAALLSLALMLPAAGAFASTHHYRHHHYYNTSNRNYDNSYNRNSYHRKHYSQTGGALVGAAAGALIDHRHPLTGALIGGAIGEGVQYERNQHVH